MTHEELVALQSKIDRCTGLKSLEQRLLAELLAEEEQNSYGVDPFTILFIISVILQVIGLCTQSRSIADVELDIANVHLLPPRKLMRLKRRLNVLWAQHCVKNGVTKARHNPFFTAAVNAIKSSNRADIIDIVRASNK